MTTEEMYYQRRPVIKAMQDQAKGDLLDLSWDKGPSGRLIREDVSSPGQVEYRSKGRMRRLREMLVADGNDEDQI